MTTIRQTHFYGGGAVWRASNLNDGANDPINDLAGKNGKRDREASLAVLSGPGGDRYIRLPRGTTGQRPSGPAAGYLRFNTTLNAAEFYDGVAWRVLNLSTARASVTYGNLNAQGDVGPGSGRVSRGNHTHAVDSAAFFIDDTGDEQAWTQNQAITAFTVPLATGVPSPTYAVVGGLPAGIVFNPSSRQISGTPSVVGSGTIRIRATNSEGSDDWTVAYATTVTTPVNLTGYFNVLSSFMGWEDNVSLGNAFSSNGAEQTLDELRLHHSGPAAGRVEVRLAPGTVDFTAAFEGTGTFTITASSGQTLAVQIANADMDLPYVWTPTNSSAVIAFANHVIGLSNRNATLVLS